MDPEIEDAPDAIALDPPASPVSCASGTSRSGTRPARSSPARRPRGCRDSRSSGGRHGAPARRKPSAGGGSLDGDRAGRGGRGSRAMASATPTARWPMRGRRRSTARSARSSAAIDDGFGDHSRSSPAPTGATSSPPVGALPPTRSMNVLGSPSTTSTSRSQPGQLVALVGPSGAGQDDDRPTSSRACTTSTGLGRDRRPRRPRR